MPVLNAPRPTGEIGCAWHRRFAGFDLVYDGQTGRPIPGFPYGQVRSHGICAECLQTLWTEDTAGRSAN